MTFGLAFNIIWIVSVVLEIWLFFLCRDAEDYYEVQVYVTFCLARAVLLGGVILHCHVYTAIWTGMRYMAMPLRGMVSYGAWRSRRDPVWREILLGFIVGTGGESACGLLVSYLQLACGSSGSNAINLVERVFFCAMLGLWIDALWKERRERKMSRLVPKTYA